MSKTVKAAVAALFVGGVTLLAAPAAATPTYPPATPSPSVSTVTPSPSSSVLGASAGRRVSDGLPRTGSELATWGGAGALLVGAGAAVTVAARRRPQRTH